MTLHLCRANVIRHRLIRDCLCGPKRRFVFEHHVWYEWRWICCRCGREWSSDRGLFKKRRPFKECDRLWRDALTRKDAEAALRDYLGEPA